MRKLSDVDGQGSSDHNSNSRLRAHTNTKDDPQELEQSSRLSDNASEKPGIEKGRFITKKTVPHRTGIAERQVLPDRVSNPRQRAYTNTKDDPQELEQSSRLGCSI
jgi:hypothetical protein